MSSDQPDGQLGQGSPVPNEPVCQASAMTSSATAPGVADSDSDSDSDSGAVTLVVGAAIVDDLDRPTTLLAARRIEPARLAGGWELPGGKVEPGEDPVAALHREIGEELGVRVVLGAELPGPDPAEPGWPLPPAHRMRVWLARVVEGEPVPLEEHDELRWLGPGQWLDVGWLPADVPIVRALLERSPAAS